jgi:cytidyltransferase-like protein
MKVRQIVVSGGFDDLRSPQIRFLEEAARLGPLTVLLSSDEAIHRLTGAPPKFPQAEREYILKAIRFVDRVEVSGPHGDRDSLPEIDGLKPDGWVVPAAEDTAAKKAFCAARGIAYHTLLDEQSQGFPELSPVPSPAGRRKVVVTGCYDWLHSGHVRFFEEAGRYGDLYVIVGHDANVRLLKGEGHPMHSQAERRYAVGSVRFVTQSLVSSGAGWLDAEPEIDRLQPDCYVVNEDGDQGGKREFCVRRGMEYVVLKRVPAPGLPSRSSTGLRGF